MSSVTPLEALRAAVEPGRRLRRDNRLKPHKIVLLLAALDVARSSPVWDGTVVPDDRLAERFRFYFVLSQGPTDRIELASPFLHLRNSDFWRLVPHKGQTEDSILQLRTGFTAVLRQHVSHAQIEGAMRAAWADERTNMACSLTLMEILKGERNVE